jgi:hypothetical protein
MSQRTPEVLLQWERVVEDLLERTASFPRSVRFTFSSRLDGLALDVYERLIEARYTPRPVETLRQVNLLLEKLRLLLRLSYRRRYLSEGGLRCLIEGVEQTGRMVGGWLKEANRETHRVSV